MSPSKVSFKVDLYALLELPPDATDQDIIKTAFHKKALKVHPDKNRDNPEAAKLFNQLYKAFKLLSDPIAKGAYDRGLKAKKESELRNRELDAKRKKLKDELEAREREAAKKKYEKSADELLRSQLARLQQQGSQYLAEQQERIRQENARERQSAQETSSIQSCMLKVKWKPSSKGDVYTRETLTSFLQKYGDITGLVVSSKKKKWAIVEFANRRDAELALSVERGLETCPLKLSMMEGQNQPMSAPIQEQTSTYQGPVAASFEEYEKQVLQNLMAAHERQRDAELALSVEPELETCPLELSMTEGQNQPMSAPIQEQESTYEGPVAASMEDSEDQVLQPRKKKRKRENSS